MSAGLIFILAGVVAMSKARIPPISNIGFVLILIGAALVAGRFLP